MTVCVQIGNSDNKLTQQDWSDYVAAIERLLTGFMVQFYFSGASISWAPWQNACWVFGMKEENEYALRDALTTIRQQYKQDSIAMLMGDVIFI